MTCDYRAEANQTTTKNALIHAVPHVMQSVKTRIPTTAGSGGGVRWAAAVTDPMRAMTTISAL